MGYGAVRKTDRKNPLKYRTAATETITPGMLK
jgi:hypothetical protein